MIRSYGTRPSEKYVIAWSHDQNETCAD